MPSLSPVHTPPISPEHGATACAAGNHQAAEPASLDLSIVFGSKEVYSGHNIPPSMPMDEWNIDEVMRWGLHTAYMANLDDSMQMAIQSTFDLNQVCGTRWPISRTTVCLLTVRIGCNGRSTEQCSAASEHMTSQTSCVTTIYVLFTVKNPIRSYRRI
jgi:hypothetical protein